MFAIGGGIYLESLVKPGSTRLSILVDNSQKPGKFGSTRVCQAHEAFNQTFGARAMMSAWSVIFPTKGKHFREPEHPLSTLRSFSFHVWGTQWILWDCRALRRSSYTTESQLIKSCRVYWNDWTNISKGYKTFRSIQSIRWLFRKQTSIWEPGSEVQGPGWSATQYDTKQSLGVRADPVPGY